MAVLGIDFDEVLCETNNSLIGWHNQEFQTSISLSSTREFGLEYLFNCGTEEALRRFDKFIYSHQERLNPVQGAQPTMQYFLQRDYRLVVVTNRAKNLSDLTLSWIQQHFAGVFSDFVFCEKPKGRTCRELNCCTLVDDHLKNANDCAKEGIPAIVFGDYAWNKGALYPNVRRAENWSYVPRLVEELQ